ncbi:hypothetical protein NE237_029523 [Protea cynaroides]|uniref:Uncharacterized protein n=1 Tax=Protea cynaroides TaxID=273540 RepID=A0A9Q0GTB4_9MAGN|nr:hypothetical protein NE237_029523 [Protea cynaroides]
MASPYTPGELKWYHLLNEDVLVRFVINLPRQVSDELKWLNFIDRELFSRLVIDLQKDIIHIMKVIALWIWLEEIGYPNIIQDLLQQPNPVLLEVTVEALNCIYYMELSTVPPPAQPHRGDMPFTQGLMRRDISIQFFYNNRYAAMLGMTKVMNNVCAKAFGDIVQQALSQPGPSGEGSSTVVGADSGSGSGSDSHSENSADEEEEISENGTDEETEESLPPPPQTMGIVGGSTANVDSVSHGFEPWAIRSQQENSDNSNDEESSSSDESD